eukprot:2412685-Amphidinium_carterae.1
MSTLKEATAEQFGGDIRTTYTIVGAQLGAMHAIPQTLVPPQRFGTSSNFNYLPCKNDTCSPFDDTGHDVGRGSCLAESLSKRCRVPATCGLRSVAREGWLWSEIWEQTEDAKTTPLHH